MHFPQSNPIPIAAIEALARIKSWSSKEFK